MANSDECAWDDDGFAPPCRGREADHCTIGTADDTCELVHHPFVLSTEEETDGD